MYGIGRLSATEMKRSGIEVGTAECAVGRTLHFSQLSFYDILVKVP